MASVEQMLKEETNPEILRDIALFINEQAKIIAEENKQLRAERDREEAEKQAWLTQSIATHLNKLRRRFFDVGRESLDLIEARPNEQDLLMHAKSLVGDVKQKDVLKNLPEEVVQCFTSPAELIMQAKLKDPEITFENADISEINGFYETSSEIHITERTYVKKVHKRQKYRIKNKLTGQEQILTSRGPVKLLPGCRYSMDFALSVVSDKFLNHLPYERQRKELIRSGGIRVPVITMYRLSEQVALHMAAVAEQIRQDIFKIPLACHLDETRWPITSSQADNGMMWILSNQAGSYYRFEPTRSGKIADELLQGYSGPVITDKYSGYTHFRENQNRKWGLCWAHARREFYDLLEVYPEEATHVVQLMDQLFAIERKAKTWDQLKELRATKSVQKVQEIKKVLEEYRASFFNQDAFCKAIHYVLSGWKEFTSFLEEVQLPLSNNDAERALRHAVLGRKNFYGSKTINGADTAATLYTIIESCKKARLNPVNYMRYVVEENQSDRGPLAPLALAKLKIKI